MIRRFSVVLVLVVRDDCERVLLFLLYAARSSLPLHGIDIRDQLWRTRQAMEDGARTHSKSSKRERARTYSKSSNRGDVFKIQQQRARTYSKSSNRER